jgi:hypothetical protein
MDATHILSSMHGREYSGQSKRARWDDLARPKFASLDLTGYRDNNDVPHMLHLVGIIEGGIRDAVLNGVSEEDAIRMFGFRVNN